MMAEKEKKDPKIVEVLQPTGFSIEIQKGLFAPIVHNVKYDEYTHECMHSGIVAKWQVGHN